MSFLQKLKGSLGIGGVKVELLPGQISRSANEVEGNVILTSKSNQNIKSIVVKLVKEWTTEPENPNGKAYLP